ncbi:MAG: transporter permease, partial [Bacilli bacterium]|nr:transporter permease [Bacilli bacterium]
MSTEMEAIGHSAVVAVGEFTSEAQAARTKPKSTWLRFEMSTPNPWIVACGRAALFVVIALIWEIGARVHVINPFFWSQPSEIAKTWWIGVQSGQVWQDTLY